MDTTNILVLCTGNSCRSQIAHGYLEKFAPEGVKVFSAGVETHGLNPRAVKVMDEDGLDISHHTSNNVSEYLDISFSKVLTVCDNAREACPVFPRETETIHHSFPDPAKAQGSEEEILNQFRAVRDEIKQYCSGFFQ